MSILDAERKTATESICVGVRLRPFVGYEKDAKQKQCLTIHNNTVSVVDDALCDHHSSSKLNTKDFAFDAAMDSTDPANAHHVDQAKCYEIMCQRMVGHILEGFHTCLFCYGQTGTGKTTTIMGDPKEEKEMGLLLRLLHDVFKEADRMKQEGSNALIQVQMLEVYNDKLNDLLHPSKDKKVHPEVRMNPVEGVYVKGSPPEAVENFQTCVKLIEYGNTMKTVAATAMNKQSSRGHTIFKLILDKKGGSEGMNITSEAFFVDLAGRENEKTTKVTGERFQELTFINLSLKFLADCIRNLGEMAKARDRPRKSTAARKQGNSTALFRNSKLTMLLANALSGNSKTAMIGTLSPAALNFDESYSTLQFASTVKSIKVDAKPAAEVDKAVLIKTLQDEVEVLKEKLAEAEGVDEETDIQQKMEDAQELFEEYRKEWDQKHEEAKAMMLKREEMTTKLGVYRWRLAMKKTKPYGGKAARGFYFDIGLPHLTNYSADPYLTGTLVLYPAEAGRTYTGGTDQGCDFVLPHALGMSPRSFHLKRSEKGQLWIWAADFVSTGSRRHTVAGVPTELSMGQSTIEVNGNKIGSIPLEMHHHDCLVLGRSLIFYVIAKQDDKQGLLATLRDVHTNRELEAAEMSRESLVSEILGEERSPVRDQVDVARKYILTLQNFNRDAEGKETLQDFLLRAQKAKLAVDEANEITNYVWPHKDLVFELVTTAPVLAFGFGKSRCPDLAVRCVQRIPLELARRRMKIGKDRRKSSMAAAARLRSFVDGGEAWNDAELEEAQVDVQFVWTFAKFAARLQLMQEVREDKEEDPERFKVDPHCNPWSEYGPGEIALIRRETSLDLEVAKEDMSRLRDERDELQGEVRELRRALAAAGGSGASVPAAAPVRAASLEDRSALQASSRAATPARRAGLGVFDGHWAHDLDGDRRVEVIEGDLIRWQDGTEMRITVEDDENFFVELHGSVFRASLVQDRLEWDDGDVWTRTAQAQAASEKPACEAEGQKKVLPDELVQLLYVNNSNVEQLRRTQQQLIQTVTDGMSTLDDKLSRAAVGGDSPSSASPTARSPTTPAPSMASHVHSTNGPYCGYLGATSASGTYFINPPGGPPLEGLQPQLLAVPASASAVAYKVPPVSPARRAPSPPGCYAAAPHALWGGSTPSSASRAVTPRSPANCPRARPESPAEPVAAPQVPMVVPQCYLPLEARLWTSAERPRERSAQRAHVVAAQAGASTPVQQAPLGAVRQSPRGPRSP